MTNVRRDIETHLLSEHGSGLTCNAPVLLCMWKTSLGLTLPPTIIRIIIRLLLSPIAVSIALA